jgi:hypothetical protein
MGNLDELFTVMTTRVEVSRIDTAFAEVEADILGLTLRARIELKYYVGYIERLEG